MRIMWILLYCHQNSQQNVTKPVQAVDGLDRDFDFIVLFCFLVLALSASEKANSKACMLDFDIDFCGSFGVFSKSVR